MFAFLMVAVLAIIVVAAIAVAYSANQRKRAGQSGEAKVNAQHSSEEAPSVGRPSGIN